MPDTEDERSGSPQPSGMAKAYDPQAVEGRIYRMWEGGGYFKAAGDPDKEPFSIIMPPPNLTGELHLGHALMDAVEDILIRWHRMHGEPTLWLPGIDHAAIAVHMLVERQLADEGLSRFDVGREQFLERVWDFVNRSRARIFDQHKRLGASADWDRETFTMDPGPARAVRTAFYQLYQRGLIYRGERIINWCPRCRTALSDLEVDHQEEQGSLWYVRYPIIGEDGRDTDQHITIATTRPETIVADTGIAVHPDDERYRDLVGRKARLPIIGRELPIVGDEAIEKEFGTGALKVTPGHDPVDFEIGQRHGLPTVSAINLDASMNAEAGPYEGMDRFACRDAIIRDLDARGFLVKTEPYAHSIGHCERCGTIVEPLISEQWFVDVNKEYAPGRSLASQSLQVVHDGLVKFLPPRFTKIYTSWMENLRDWCISRQLWWGHPIPVWYCDACNAAIVPPPDVEAPGRCDRCGAGELRQDQDTLDTWFSSGLWPASTLGWPDDTEDLRRFYPTTVMETAYEIIFFWVARMILMCQFVMDPIRDRIEERIPFRYVYLHGLVRDDKGQKMSKTRGNVVDPLLLVDKYGADALRFSIVTAGGMGQDQRLREDKVEAGRNFANKLWNAARYVVMTLPQPDPENQAPSPAAFAPPSPADRASLPPEDRWILSRLDGLVADVDRLLTEFQLNEAGHRIYGFLWGEYCDWYVEMAKVRLREGGPDPRPVLVHVLETGLRLLHPYMPFVTEELWQTLRPHVTDPGADALIVAPYPQPAAGWRDEDAEQSFEGVIDLVRAIRNIRSEKGVEPARYIEAYVVAIEQRAAIEAGAPYIEALARVRPLHIVEDAADAPRDGVATAVLPHAQAVVPLAGLLDVEAERARLQKVIAEVEGYAAKLQGKLSNEQFRSRAPADVVAAEKDRLASAQTRLEGLRRALRELG
jgi:valyl-tRNA synthetase